MHPARAEAVLKDAMDIIDAVRECREGAGLQKVVERLKAVFCADFFVMGFPSKDWPFNYCDFPKEWQYEYAARRMWKIDPIIRYQAGSDGSSQYWFRALRSYPVAEYAPLMTLSLDVGLRFGVCNSVRDVHTDKIVVVSVSATNNNFRAHHKILLDIVSPHLYLAFHPHSRRERPLTPRELEVLRWVAEGKTNWEIGRILRVSENTVRFHLKNINYKLNASNKYHAVAIAMAQKLLSL